MRILLTLCVVALAASFGHIAPAAAQATAPAQKAEGKSDAAKTAHQHHKASPKAKRAKKPKSTEQYLRIAP